MSKGAEKTRVTIFNISLFSGNKFSCDPKVATVILVLLIALIMFSSKSDAIAICRSIISNAFGN